MDKRYGALDVFNAKREKLCCLYDSNINAKGQAHSIVYRREIGGFKSVSFTLPRVVDEKKNFRWDYIKNEYQLRLTVDGKTDWFTISSPVKEHGRSGITATVSCNHISMNLKTKNLYMTFDDENGIGTIQYLMKQVLKGTGWSLGNCDTFYERDGVTEKIRSLTSDGKVGTYQLISNICSLFNAYPEYVGETKTVNIHAFNKKGALAEMTMGKDIDSLSVDYNSEDIITRLYVEGEYSDDGYVSIDIVNPTGLSYLMNFDYYKEIGMFTEEHQAALDKFYADMKTANDAIKSVAGDILDKETELNELWGQIDYIIYYGENMESRLLGGEVLAEDLDIKEGDTVTIVANDKTIRTVLAGENGQVEFSSSDRCFIKFITLPSGSIGAKQVAIESKEKLIKELNDDITNKGLTDEKIQNHRDQIDKLEAEIEQLCIGSEDTVGLYDQMWAALDICFDLKDKSSIRHEALENQEAIEAEFFAAMGDMLREGYWNNVNYAVGQEQFLYEDSLDVMKEMSRPAVTYSVSRVPLAAKMMKKPEDLDLNMCVRIYDPDIKINDMVYISAIDCCLDKRHEDSVELSNDDLVLTNVTFDSVLSRMTQLADLIEQKNALFSRSEAITEKGSIPMERLEGTINILKHQLSSAVSSWYTDVNGNIIFESTTGKSAMMLTGDGFMIAAGKTDSGDWNWRTFGTGEGFTADAIITGYLSADRIEAGTITASHLASNIGESLDLSSNTSINMIVSSKGDQIKEEVKNEVGGSIKDDIMTDVDALIGYRIEIYSTSDILSTDIKQATIYARVWHGSQNVTDQLDASRFIWTRVSGDPTADEIWNKNHIGVKSFTATSLDVWYSATYTCELQDA